MAEGLRAVEQTRSKIIHRSRRSKSQSVTAPGRAPIEQKNPIVKNKSYQQKQELKFLREYGDFLDDKEDRPMYKLTQDERKSYDPKPKGKASWKQTRLETADGWTIEGRPVRDYEYESVTGLDLVNWFTWNHLSDLEIEKQWARLAAEDNSAPVTMANAPNLRPQCKKSQNQLQKCNEHRRQRHRRASPFLNLPAEIRNQIYSYVVADSRVLIHGNHPNKEHAVLKSFWNPENKPVIRPRYRLHHSLDNGDIEDGLEVSPVLLLTCKKIKKEVELFMYSQVTFCFDSMNVLHKFLNGASKDGIKSIKKLEIYLDGHGNPSSTGGRGMKEKYDTRWLQTCQRVAQDIPALQHLRLEVVLRDWPLTLGPEDEWWQTLLVLVPNSPLDNVKIKLTHAQLDHEELASASRRLEDCMMNERGKKARDEREANWAIQQYYAEEAAAQAARRERLKSLPPIQAKKVLTIVIDEESKKNTETPIKNEPKKYYSSKTAGYARDIRPQLPISW